MRRSHLVASIALLAVVCLLVGTSVSAAADAKKYSWTMTTPFPHSDVAAQRMMAFAKAVEKDTNGQFRIKVLVSGQHPYQYRDGLRVVTEGLTELSHTGLTYLTSVESWFCLPLVPYAIPLEYHRDFTIRWHEEIVKPYLQKKYNLKTLAYFMDSGGWGNAIHTPIPFVKFDSLKGLKIRAHDKNTAHLAKVFGASPATVPYSELYVAVQRKAIDGVMTSVQGAFTQKLWELLKYTCLYEPYFGMDEFLVDIDKWNKVPADLRTQVEGIFQEWLSLEPMYKHHSASNEKIMAEAKEKYGATFNTLDPAIAKRAREECQVLYDNYLAQGGEMAKKSMDLLNEVLKKK